MDIFNVTIYEDVNGTRFIYCDSAIASIGAPTDSDKILAKFSNEHEENKKYLESNGWMIRGNGTWSHPKDDFMQRSEKDAIYLTKTNFTI